MSALANRPEGGLLIIGLVTRHQDGRDVVTRVRTQPVDLLRGISRKYALKLPTNARICRDEARQRLASTGVVYGPSDRFITFSQQSIGLAA